LAPSGACCLGLKKQLACAFGELLTSRGMMRGDNRKRGVRHERATLS
jgi:hypothetical protein